MFPKGKLTIELYYCKNVMMGNFLISNLDMEQTSLVKSKFQRDNEDPLQKNPLMAIMFRLENNMDNLLLQIFARKVYFTKVSRFYIFFFFKTKLRSFFI